MSEPLVLEVFRSDVRESTHVVDCVLVDASGRVRATAGDAGVIAFFRSVAKPLQAAVCLGEGWEPADERHVAIACGSHSGEEAHVDAVRAMLRSAGLDEAALRCPSATPIGAPQATPARVAHNCSGKHAAMLATAARRGWSLDDYTSPAHPLQRAVRALLEACAGATGTVGVDGCGVPTFAVPLASIARAFARLAREGEPFARAASAMRAHPFYVAGTRRACTAVMTALPGVVAKVGAEGLGCVIAPSGECAAFKARDGAMRARDAMIAAILPHLGIELPPALQSFAAPDVIGGTDAVGRIRLRGALAPAT